MRANGTFIEIGTDATVRWMVDDIAGRCHAVLDALDHPSRSVATLGNAGMVLRSAADDLVSLLELVDGPTVTVGDDSADAVRAFELAFDLPTHTPD